MPSSNRKSTPDPSTPPADAFIIDPNLQTVLGHYFEYDAAVARGLRAVGQHPVVLAHRFVDRDIVDRIDAQPTFRHTIWPDDGRAGRWPTAKANLAFLVDLLRAIRREPRGRHVVCFAHTFINRQFLALAVLPLLLFGRRSYAFVYLFRYQAGFYQGRLARLGFRLLEALARWRSIRLASDSDRLAADLQHLTGLPVEVLPIPHVPPPDVPRAKADHDHRCHFVSLGNARDEKGILEILDAIRWLRDNNQRDGCRFTLQCNDAVPDIAAAITAFRDEHVPDCCLLFNTLPSAAYYEILWQADVVLLPYWSSIYASRTSGVFMEALSAGKPVIASDSTWMAAQLANHGAGLVCRERDPVSLAQTMRAARDQCAELTARAQARSGEWLATHNPTTLAERLMQRRATDLVRHIALLYPWSDIAAPQGGAGRRCSLLLEFLRTQSVEIAVLSGGDAPTRRADTVTFETIGSSSRPLQATRLLLRAVLRLRYGKAGRALEWLVWEFLRPRLDLRLRRQLGRVVANTDVVLLEYPFWASVVVPAAHRAGRRVVITAHDILSDQAVGVPPLHRLLWRWERQALLAADAVVAVSSTDVARLAEHGIAAELAPNPADVQAFASLSRAPAAEIADAARRLDLPFRKIALFVGSRHPPNLVAVDHLHDIAAELAARPDAGDIGIVVAGSCAEQQRSAHFAALGQVDEPLLLELYRIAAAAIIPLASGTGSSLKTVEAMAAGMPVLGTPVAFRGLEIEDGDTALIEPEFNRFAARLVSLLHDEASCARIGEAARQFAAQFDYRLCFQPYLPLLGLAAHEK